MHVPPISRDLLLQPLILYLILTVGQLLKMNGWNGGIVADGIPIDLGVSVIFSGQYWFELDVKQLNKVFKAHSALGLEEIKVFSVSSVFYSNWDVCRQTLLQFPAGNRHFYSLSLTD